MRIKHHRYYPRHSVWQKKSGYSLILPITLSLVISPISVLAAAVDDSTASVAVTITPTQSSNNTVTAQNVPAVDAAPRSKDTVSKPQEPNLQDSTLKDDSDITSVDSTGVDATGRQEENETLVAGETSEDQTTPNIQSDSQTVSTPIALAKEKSNPLSWLQLEYLLAALLIVTLVRSLVLMRRTNTLRADNEMLKTKISSLHKDKQQVISKLKQSIANNEALKDKFIQLQTVYGEQQSINKDATSSLPLIEPLADVITIDDLNASDCKQLSAMMTQWLMTNRGNTDFMATVPKELQRKLQHWQYAIRLWQQSSGVDAVELTNNTMHVAVISLITPDQQGYAYCYKKPNSLSTVWASKSWYRVQQNDGTLTVLGEVSEFN